MKRGKMTEKNNSFSSKKISNRLSYTILFTIALILVGVFVIAQKPNPGHDYSEVFLGPIHITGDAGNVGIGTTSPSYKLDVDGTVRAREFIYRSDESFKTNIQPLENSLKKVSQLQGVSFDWKSTNKRDIGFIAQDLEKVYPEFVYIDEDGTKSVDYGKIVAILVESIKEQQSQIESLQKEIEELKEK